MFHGDSHDQGKSSRHHEHGKVQHRHEEKTHVQHGKHSSHHDNQEAHHARSKQKHHSDVNREANSIPKEHQPKREADKNQGGIPTDLFHIGKPQKEHVASQQDTTTHEQSESHKVKASWYHEGSKTANGERFKPDGLTVAHKSLPFGTILEVRNPDNNHTVTVRVNDRGPFIKGREIDLSRGAARQLGMLKKGVGDVEYKIVGHA